MEVFLQLLIWFRIKAKHTYDIANTYFEELEPTIADPDGQERLEKILKRRRKEQPPAKTRSRSQQHRPRNPNQYQYQQPPPAFNPWGYYPPPPPPHAAPLAPPPARPPREQLQCTICNRLGHTAATCFHRNAGKLKNPN